MNLINALRFVLICLLLAFPCISSAQSPGSLKIATTSSSPPYIIYDDNNHASGIVIDMWRQWAETQGYQVSFHPMGIDEGVMAVRDGEMDIHAGVFDDYTLPFGLVTAKPFYGIAVGLFQKNMTSINQFQNRVAMRKELITSPEIKRFLPDTEIFPIVVDTDREALELLYEEEVDSAFVASLEASIHYLDQAKYSGLIKTSVLLNGFSLLYPVVSSHRAELIERIDQGFDSIDRGWLSSNEIAYLSSGNHRYFNVLTSLIRLSAREQSFFSSLGTIRVVFPRDAYGPFYFQSAQDQTIGMDPDLLALIETRTGLSFEIINVDTWTDALEMMASRDADLLTSVVQTPEREQILSFSNPYYQSNDAIITRREDSVRGLRDLREKLVAIPRNWRSVDALRRANPDVRLFFTESVEEALALVANGDVFAYVGNSLNASFEMDRSNFTNLKIATPVDLGHPPLRIAVRSDWPELTSIINKGLSTVSQAELTAIKNRWFKVQYDFGVNRQQVFQAAGFFGLVIAGIFLGIFMWNQRLRSEVQARLAAEEKLIAARVAAESAAAAKSNFLATMSHEIRTPLNGVLGMVEILSKSDLNHEQRDYLKTIQASGSSLLEILNDVLDFSKIDAGKLELERVPSNLDLVVLNAVKIMRPVALKRGLTIELNNHLSSTQGYFIDPTRVRQVVLNLVGNAVKFTNNGSIAVEMTAAEDDHSRICISVIDEGVGIPTEKLETIFAPFEQAEQSTTRQFGGTGLGLSISKQLAELMDGSLTLQHNQPMGTIATFCFRAMACERPREQDPQLAASIQFSKSSILLVDDHHTNQRVALAQLNLLGLTADLANNGIEALEMINNKDYDVILSDCHMPRMDGYELVQQIRRNEAIDRNIKQTIVIAVTANAIDGEREHCLAVGFDDFLPKPFGIDELASLLKKYLKIDEPTDSLGVESDEDNSAIQIKLSSINFDEVKRLVGGDEAFKVIILEFLNNTSDDLALIKQGIKDGAPEMVQSAAHRIKGTAAMVGAASLGELAKTFDEMAKSSNLHDCEARIPELMSQWRDLLQAVEGEIGKLDESLSQYD